MNNQTPTQNLAAKSGSTSETPPTPWRCLTGALISGGIGYALYSLTISIAQTFANKPIHSDNVVAVNIAAAVRTLVVGMSALGTGIFCLVAIGLVALASQILIQQLTKRPDSP